MHNYMQVTLNQTLMLNITIYITYIKYTELINITQYNYTVTRTP